MTFKDEVHLVTAGDRFKTTSKLVYEGRDNTFEVPTGVFTDFASVPRVMRWFAPSTGAYTRAAVLHDYLCDRLEYDGTYLHPTGHELGEVITSRDVDGLFRRVMREEGVPLIKRWLMWAGVRWGSIFSRERRAVVGSDLPKLLLITLLGLPLFLPGIVVGTVSWLVYYVIEGFVGWVVEPLTGDSHV